MQSELASMGLRLKSCEAQGAASQAHIQKLETELGNLRAQCKTEIINEIESAKGNIQIHSTTAKTTVVIGNVPPLNASSFEDAKNWVIKRCMDSGIPQPVELFFKGDKFEGVMFAKCSSSPHRDLVISTVRNTPNAAAPKPWAKIDEPLDTRTAEAVLFGFKRLLVEWGYSKKSVWVDCESLTLKVAGAELCIERGLVQWGVGTVGGTQD